MSARHDRDRKNLPRTHLPDRASFLMDAPPHRPISAKEIAEAFDVSVEAVHRYLRPASRRRSDDFYIVADILKWWSRLHRAPRP